MHNVMMLMVRHRYRYRISLYWHVFLKHSKIQIFRIALRWSLIAGMLLFVLVVMGYKAVQHDQLLSSDLVLMKWVSQSLGGLFDP